MLNMRIGINNMTPKYHQIIQQWLYKNDYIWNSGEHKKVIETDSIAIAINCYKSKDIVCNYCNPFTKRQCDELYESPQDFINKYIKLPRKSELRLRVEHFRIPNALAKFHKHKKSLPAKDVFSMAYPTYSFDEYDDGIYPRGGATRVWYEADNVTLEAFAICSWQDRYDKRKGVAIATQRLHNALQQLMAENKKSY